MFYNQESEPWPGQCVGESFSHSWIYQVEEYSFEEFHRLRLDALISMKMYLKKKLLPRNISRQKAWLKSHISFDSFLPTRLREGWRERVAQ